MENTAHLRVERRINPGKLIAARLGKGIQTQREMASLIGMTRTNYSTWEKSPPERYPFRHVNALLTVLNKTWEDISDPIT
ncbi:helix-turn-helix domain-containing protein [Deinococcus multiflagellatus]|uniref:Helix-turn-helix domain-containing protein n=1 Tax=Deinococcus multiflagellatus TaxID=1656887 RepID=A0ABW1ZRV6_9DEIO|nr:helix-turn-helix transcriptional regulator [Deinococcus multiflagellatus]MBZ9715328.1 helix-turn-helix domain-containing protein [Deinococcus multiflagellatus]